MSEKEFMSLGVYEFRNSIWFSDFSLLLKGENGTERRE
mgnify:CR=1 FL=1